PQDKDQKNQGQQTHNEKETLGTHNDRYSSAAYHLKHLALSIATSMPIYNRIMYLYVCVCVYFCLYFCLHVRSLDQCQTPGNYSANRSPQSPQSSDSGSIGEVKEEVEKGATFNDAELIFEHNYYWPEFTKRTPVSPKQNVTLDLPSAVEEHKLEMPNDRNAALSTFAVASDDLKGQGYLSITITYYQSIQIFFFFVHCKCICLCLYLQLWKLVDRAPHRTSVVDGKKPQSPFGSRSRPKKKKKKAK
ncbi:hypothetical protein RFI_23251, partial [Reticulomyxa filosa]